ncbi:dTDP-4-dehydrorhamnose reductase [Desulfobacterales bacterium HSG16]|nr:dTDP-4-dehydrorhamnose reductase [Desulfobacterales bacterium HSG16]
MKILVTGAGGQLGKELVRSGKKTDMEIHGFLRDSLDICNQDQINRVFEKVQPDIVVNTAAYTNVDKAETEIDTAFAINREGACHIAGFCGEADIPMIHISTDFVFDGSGRTPYTEEEPTNPLSVYGLSKAEGEEAVMSLARKHIIIRTSWLYGEHGNNFVKTMIRVFSKNKNVRVVSDQLGCPTNASDLAGAVLQIARIIKNQHEIDWGIYHYSGYGITSWHEFAENILRIAGAKLDLKTEKIEPITTQEWPTDARRPMFSVLDCSKLEKKFNITPEPWKQSLETFLCHNSENLLCGKGCYRK